MSWSEIKHAINDTLGTTAFKPLNKWIEDYIKNHVNTTIGTAYEVPLDVTSQYKLKADPDKLYTTLTYMSSQTLSNLTESSAQQFNASILCAADGNINVTLYVSATSSHYVRRIGWSFTSGITDISDSRLRQAGFLSANSSYTNEPITFSTPDFAKGNKIYLYAWSSYNYSTGGPSLTLNNLIDIKAVSEFKPKLIISDYA